MAKEVVVKIKLDVDDSDLVAKIKKAQSGGSSSKKDSGGAGDVLSSKTGFGGMIKQLFKLMTGIELVNAVLGFIKGVIMGGFEGVMKLVSALQKVLSMMVMPFANLLIPILIPLLRILMPVVKILNRIMMPIYQKMMKAMSEADNPMEGLAAGLGVGLAELSKLMMVLFGEVIKVLARVFMEAMIWPIQMMTIAITGTLTQIFQKIGLIDDEGAAAIGRFVNSVVLGMETVKQGTIGVIDGAVNLLTNNFAVGLDAVSMSVSDAFTNMSAKSKTELTLGLDVLSNMIGNFFGAEVEAEFREGAADILAWSKDVADAVGSGDMDRALELLKGGTALALSSIGSSFGKMMMGVSLDLLGTKVSLDSITTAVGKLADAAEDLVGIVNMIKDPVGSIGDWLGGRFESSSKGGYGSNITNGVSPFNFMPQAATGGTVEETGMAVIHKGETITPAGESSVVVNMPINVAGGIDQRTYDKIMKEVQYKLQRMKTVTGG